MIKRLFSNKYFIIIFAVTILLLITLVFSINRSYETKASDNIVVRITMPIQKFVYNISSGVNDFFSHFGDTAKLKTENDKLKEQIAKLKSDISRNKSYKDENERLRSLLSLSDTYSDFKLVAANVTGKDSSQWFLSITIDKGTDDGLKMSDAVITYDGLVGHITDIGKNWARITTILDSKSTVAVIVERTQDLATVDGNIDLSEKGLCKMTYISKDSTVTVGDIAKTSGLGGVYPKGLMVGKIKEIHSENQGVSQYADIEPAVNFDKIFEVMVITN